MRTFKATVTDVKWFTTSLGFVRPVAVLDKMYSKKVNNIKEEEAWEEIYYDYQA